MSVADKRYAITADEAVLLGEGDSAGFAPSFNSLDTGLLREAIKQGGIMKLICEHFEQYDPEKIGYCMKLKAFVSCEGNMSECPKVGG